jgi:hypothetical protein
MLRVTIELLPRGDESRARKIGTLLIANDATGTETIGNYRGTLHAEYTGLGGRTGHVENFNRKTQSVWSLVGAFLKGWGHTKHSPAHIKSS